MVNINIKTTFNFSKARKEKIKIKSLVLLFLIIQIFSKEMTNTWCFGGRYYSETVNENLYEKNKTLKLKSSLNLSKVYVVFVEELKPNFY